MTELIIIEEPLMADDTIKCNALTAVMLAKNLGVKSFTLDGEKVDLHD